MSLEFYKEKIKEIEELQHLFLDDPQIEYDCSPNIQSLKFSHLHKCVMQTGKYPFLNEYIDLYLIVNPETINLKNEKGWTALMLAVRNSITLSSEKTVKILLKHYANVNIQEENGVSALMLAARYSRTDSSEKTVKLLLKHGANLNLENENGWTALMLAAQYSGTDSSESTVKLILDHGLNINLKKNFLWSALQYALFYSSSLVIGSILSSYIKKSSIMNINESERSCIIRAVAYTSMDKKNKVIRAFQNYLEIEYAEEKYIQNRFHLMKIKDIKIFNPRNYPRIIKSKLRDFKFNRNLNIKTIREIFVRF